jgi:hypothetical protein
VVLRFNKEEEMNTRHDTSRLSTGEGENDGRLLFRNTMQITEGHLDDFRQAIEDAVDFAEQHAPQLMVDVFVDEDRHTATSFQIYPDSQAVLRHWELSDPYISKVMEHCSVAKFEVFGSPSDEVRNGFGRMSGVDVSMQPRLTGYLKLADHGTDGHGDQP